MTAKKKAGGGKLTRSEIVTVRLDPKLRFGLELAARKQRRTASSFVEWAVEQTLKNETIGEGMELMPALKALDRVWDTDESDRFVRLALYFPELLTHEEQVLWKLIREYGFLWKGAWNLQGEKSIWHWSVCEQTVEWERLRRHWALLKAVAAGDQAPDALPDWDKERDPQPGDIPF